MPRARRGAGALRAVLLSLVLVATGLSAAGSPAAAAGTFNLVNHSTGRCIGIETTHNYAGDWTCTTNPDQTWHWGAADGNFHQLVNGNGKCLATSGGDDAQGTRLIAYTCLGIGSTDQYWAFGPSLGPGPYLVNDRASGDLTTAAWIVGVSGGSAANGAALVLWVPVSHPDQFWCVDTPC